MKSRWLSVFVALAFVACGLAANVAYSQTTGEITGTVTDNNNSPLPGASVEARSTALQGTRSSVTDSAGRFRFAALPPGVYTVTASLSGFTKVEKGNVRVSLGSVASVPVMMAVSGVKEEIVVTGEAPVIDMSKTTIGVTGSSEQISRLPLARNFVSVMSTAPGTGTDNSGGITVYGATGLENQYIIDGVNTTGIKIGDQGKLLNNEFVQEVEVKTGGYEAEYGRALGGIVNVVTKSGGNEFHGDVFGYYDSKSADAKDQHTEDRAATNLSQFYLPTRYDYGAGIGGFALKDRIWFYGAANRVGVDQDFTRVESLSFTPAGVATSNTKDGTDVTRRTLWSGKLTFRLGESNTIAGSVFGDPTSFHGRQTTTRGPDSGVIWDSTLGGTDITAKWDGIFGTSFLGQAQYGYHEERNFNSSPYENTLGVFEQRNGLSYIIPGAGPLYFSDEKYRRNGYKAAGTFFLSGHEIKAGVDYENLNSTFSEKYPGGARIFNLLSNGGAFLYQYTRYFMKTPLNCTGVYDAAGNLTTGNFGSPSTAAGLTNCAGWQLSASVDNPPTTRNLGLFAQDSWKVLRNLTVNAGVRYEEQRLLDGTGVTAIKLTGEWSPRIGIVWDPANNGKSKVYGSYGRFYSTIPQDIQTRSLGNEYTFFAISYNQSAKVINPYTDFGYTDYDTLQGGELTQEGLKGMYQDEMIAGVEYELVKGWSFGIKGIYKKLGRVTEDRCDLLDPRVQLQSYLPPGATTTCALINPGNDSALQNIKDPTNPACVAADGTMTGPCDSIKPSRAYHGLETTVNHRFSHNFYMLASYIYSKLQGNYSGNFSQTRETGQSDPNINADFDYIDLTPNNFGKLRNDRTHQLKLTATYALPFGLVASTNARFATGRPMSARSYARPGYSQEHYITARGSFATLPSVYQIDLHFEYGLKLGPVSLTPVFDILNVTNVQTVLSRDEVFCTSSSATTGCAAHVNDAGVIIPSSNPLYASTPTRIAGPLTNARAQNTNFDRDIQWQQPLVLRFGARVSF